MDAAIELWQKGTVTSLAFFGQIDQGCLDRCLCG